MSCIENIQIAKENVSIIKNGCLPDGTALKLTKKEAEDVIILSPAYFESLRTVSGNTRQSAVETTSWPIMRVMNCDSFTPIRKLSRMGVETVLVMNFANAIHPGGGYLKGSQAQEESLCRQSTLYTSISSVKAAEMYRFNEKNRTPFDSEYMLLSPHVEVFRDMNGSILSESFLTAVMTAPAPNLFGRAAHELQQDIDTVMKQRIRNYLLAAKAYGYTHLILGAWGCGAFGHDAKKVARYYRNVLYDERYGTAFKEIIFAVLDTTVTMYNYHAFLEEFNDMKLL